MKQSKPPKTTRAFPIKKVIIDTFDKDMNGINEHALSFKEAVPLRLDDATLSYADSLREFALYLIKEKEVVPDKKTVVLHVKTNTFKKVSISCLVNLRRKSDSGSKKDSGNKRSKVKPARKSK